MKTLKQVSLAGLLLVCCSACIEVDNYVDPNQSCNPNTQALSTVAGLSTESQTQLVNEFNKTDFDALVVVRGQNALFQHGETRLPMNCASARKSIFSMLYGIAESKGIVNLDATLAQLGIDDSKNPLTTTEKQATLRNLLQARSGIYIPALGESSSMKRRRPKRGQYKPGEHFYYNNWDFNTLPIYLERVTGKKIGELIYEWLAVPTGMRDFCPDNVKYEYGNYTEYPQTRVYISAEDLARLGSLMLQGGVYNGQQIVPKKWVDESTRPVSMQGVDNDLSAAEQPFYDGYAYLWWTNKASQTFWADGAGGHFLIVDRSRNLAVVLRNNTGTSPAGVVWYNSTSRYQDEVSGYTLFQLIKNAL
ncbi:beta-lactamase [Fibrisoma limi BUZ 3]|uniref:Beta-lactamase n=1 Tax=Fibrisoma limi BUZ 3 TaxID=1185876 RepID=I2GCV7_9BACT|nr:serine hydrolase [Fibrisoma limi]CCH51731.1 beta-lactamase [Fibrisoma limi BUZ 3]